MTPDNTLPPLTRYHNARLATLLPGRPWGWIEDGALLVQGQHLAWVGEAKALPVHLAQRITEDHDVDGALVTPGLVDCHTHLVYGGQRAAEF